MALQQDARRDSYPGWGLDGVQLHAKGAGIPPDCWCITRADLCFLRQEIQHAVHEGKIKPTEIDPFGVDDMKIGPCMYNVVDSYIKPLTEEAGKMSWALLRHPEGLKCDLFITHCWAEGAYEMIDKILASWPRGKTAAWCCIYANPQNLNIDELIREPRSSPFAVALQSASHVMVLPTRRSGVYSRIWCVYEAFLAMEFGKIVFTASSSITRWIVFALLRLGAAAGVGFMVGFFGGAEISPGGKGFLGYLIDELLLLMLAMALFGQLLLAVCPRWAILISTSGMSLTFLALGWSLGTMAFAVIGPIYHVMYFCFPMYFISLDMDRLWAFRYREEAGLLSRGFSGIIAANATSEEDKERILQDIGAKASEVDRSIQVLIDAGMSTDSLRQAFVAGVHVNAAGEFRLSFLCVACSTFMGCTVVSAFSSLVFVPLSAALALANTVSWVRSEADERSFHAVAGSKHLLLMWLWGFSYFLWYQAEGHKTQEYISLSQEMQAQFQLCGILNTSGSFFTLLCGLLGRGRLAQIPVAGPFIVEFLGADCCCCHCGRRCTRTQVVPELLSKDRRAAASVDVVHANASGTRAAAAIVDVVHANASDT